jgi:CRP-like cAMP-binding protein
MKIMDMSIDMDKKKSFVRKQACFSQLTEDEINQLAELFKETHVKANETIATEGDHVDSVFLIIDGKADVRHVTIQNKKTHIQSFATLSVGDAIGLNETGFYSLSGLRTATVVAITDMVLLQLSLAAFHGFALAYPHVTQIMRKNAETVTGK